MSAFTTSIPNLLNGVSTQAAVLRLITQGEEQINGYSTLTKGLLKRPPSLLVKNMGGITGASSSFVHFINRDAVERYIVMVTNGDLRVYDLAGNQKLVNFPNGKTYLNNASPRSGFSAVTVSDYTFIVNKDTTVAMASDRTPKRNPEAIINVMAGNYMKNYRVWVNENKVAHYTTGDGVDSSTDPSASSKLAKRQEDENIATNYIAQALLFGDAASGVVIGGHTVTDGIITLGGGNCEIVTTLAANLPSTSWTLKRIDNAVYIQRKDTTDFAIRCEDGFNGNAMKVIKTSTQRFTNLPLRAPEGFHVEITGESSNSFDNYYVKFETNQNADNGEGVWKETIKQDIQYKFNAATMPHILVREADGSFTFKQAEWNDRIAGDETSSPNPSFVGQKVTDVFYHRNRLGMIAGESVCLSASGDVFNFWRRTVTTLLDTDPIDIGPSFPKVAFFKYAQSFNGDLLLFAENLQARLTGGDLLTPRTSAMRLLGEYGFDASVRPLSTGSLMYWAARDEGRTVIRELWLDETGTIQTPLEANSHCPEFIPKNVYKLSGSTDLNLVMALSSDTPTRMYVYKYYWANKEKPQASWSYWDFGKTILSCDFIDTDLYVLILDGSDVRLLRVPCQVDYKDANMSFPILLDQRVLLSGGSYDVTSNRTTYILPYTAPSNIEAWAGYSASGLYKAGYSVPISEVNGTTLRLTGDTRNETVYAGLPYTFRYRFSPLYVRRQSSAGSVQVITEGRTQVLRMRITFGRNAYFRVQVTPLNRPSFDEEVNTYLLDDPLLSTTDITLEDGDYSFPVKAENNAVEIDIINDKAVPSGIISAEWVGLWYPKTRRA